MTALQAVTAADLDGDTIHHALGMNPFAEDASAGSGEKDRQKQQDVSKRVMQLRWLIIDEISMVSAKLLAETDLKLREIVRSIGTLKNQKEGLDRSFGGINVLFAGDF